MQVLSAVESAFQFYGEWIQTISVVFGVGGSVSLLGVRYYRDGEVLSELLLPAMTVGFAAAHFPTSILLVVAAVHPKYVIYLEDQRTQMALVGVALAVWVWSSVQSRLFPEVKKEQ